MFKYLAFGLVAVTLLAGCQSQNVDRAGKLLGMAGEEGASISNKLDRFGRQLNIADIQLRTGRTADADKMLMLARDTLVSAGKTDMDDFHRIAGWTAIAQLSLRAQDRDLALKSADQAQAALNDVQPVAERAQYVLSLSGVLAEVRNKEAAIELINSGGAWAGEITEAGVRRQALMAFTSQLLAYDAFENARTLLRRDPDAAWRTDTMLSLALASADSHTFFATSSAAAQIALDGAAAGGGGAQESINAQVGRSSRAGYGRDIRFESVYQQNH